GLRASGNSEEALPPISLAPGDHGQLVLRCRAGSSGGAGVRSAVPLRGVQEVDCRSPEATHWLIRVVTTAMGVGATGRVPVKEPVEPALARRSASSLPGWPECPGIHLKDTLLEAPKRLSCPMQSRAVREQVVLHGAGADGENFVLEDGGAGAGVLGEGRHSSPSRHDAVAVARGGVDLGPVSEAMDFIMGFPVVSCLKMAWWNAGFEFERGRDSVREGQQASRCFQVSQAEVAMRPEVPLSEGELLLDWDTRVKQTAGGFHCLPSNKEGKGGMSKKEFMPAKGLEEAALTIAQQARPCTLFRTSRTPFTSRALFRMKLAKEMAGLTMAGCDSTPKFFRACPVPIALKAAVNAELGRLQALGVIELVVSPIKSDAYPIPNVEFPFAERKNAKKFDTVDLCSVCLAKKTEEVIYDNAAALIGPAGTPGTGQYSPKPGALATWRDKNGSNPPTAGIRDSMGTVKQVHRYRGLQRLSQTKSQELPRTPRDKQARAALLLKPPAARWPDWPSSNRICSQAEHSAELIPKLTSRPRAPPSPPHFSAQDSNQQAAEIKARNMRQVVSRTD
uniref:PIH1 domain-containing protein n=1 Tax=Macrostomum lignano TaxID=282301 RepID=A0A1I8IVT3_9PLAT